MNDTQRETTKVSNSFFTTWKFYKVVWRVVFTQQLHTDDFPCSTKPRSPESLSDHYYHTNRQIYLTTLVLSHNTYSLVLLLELE